MRASTVAVAASVLTTTALAATVCNGDASLCERLYSNVTYIGTHNSYSVGTAVANNQLKDVTAQLNDGVRALQVQTNMNGSTINLCHSNCALQNSGPFEDYLREVAAWLNANPNEVVSMIIVNQANKPASEYAPIFQAAGLDQKAYAPPSATLGVGEWPSLGTLIDSGKQLVVFLNYEADFTSTPWLIDEFSNMWEDAYDVTDQTFQCAVNRTNGDSNSQLYMINHFLDSVITAPIVGNVFIPDTTKLNETNAASGPGSINFHVDNCLSLYGRNPNIILLDYYDSMGSAPFEVANQLNGLPAPTSTVSPADYSQITGRANSSSGGSDANVSTQPLPGNGAGGLSPAAVVSVSAAVICVIAGAFVV